MDLNRNLPSVDASRFSMVPRADIPRSKFITEHTHKSTFDAAYLVPILMKEILPGDVIQGQVTIFARLATPIFPIMDDLTVSTFFFFVPMRIIWDNSKRFFGERKNPADSISYTIPKIVAPAGGFAICSIYDYLGYPTQGQIVGANTPSYNVLPLRAYNLIWNEWFRDQNLQNGLSEWRTDGPDPVTDYALRKRGKRHDYFTSALPTPLKGGVDINALGALGVPIKGIGVTAAPTPTAGPVTGQETGGTSTTSWSHYYTAGISGNLLVRAAGASTGSAPQITVDVSTTVSALRLAFQTQRLLERDNRSGTRYTEILRAHFGVEPQDSRLQRPEYIGGGRTSFQTQAIPQTNNDRNASTNAINNPLGSLGATALANDQHSFTLRAQEHGYIIGLANVRAELSYHQGVHRSLTRDTRYDFYIPVFANLAEQAVLLNEIYAQGTAADYTVFGYQERWAEYRHEPNRITGLFKARSTGNIDEWHLAEEFATAPALNSTFIEDKTNTILTRILRAGSNEDTKQILWDSVFRIESTRPLPMYSVPGNMDHL